MLLAYSAAGQQIERAKLGLHAGSILQGAGDFEPRRASRRARRGLVRIGGPAETFLSLSRKNTSGGIFKELQ